MTEGGLKYGCCQVKESLREWGLNYDVDISLLDHGSFCMFGKMPWSKKEECLVMARNFMAAKASGKSDRAAIRHHSP